MSAPTAGLPGRLPADQCCRQPGMQISWLFLATLGICSLPVVRTAAAVRPRRRLSRRAPHRTYRSISRPMAALPGPRCPISRKPSASPVARPSREETAIPRLLSRDGSATSMEYGGSITSTPPISQRPPMSTSGPIRTEPSTSPSASPVTARTGIAGFFRRATRAGGILGQDQDGHDRVGLKTLFNDFAHRDRQSNLETLRPRAGDFRSILSRQCEHRSCADGCWPLYLFMECQRRHCRRTHTEGYGYGG